MKLFDGIQFSPPGLEVRLRNRIRALIADGQPVTGPHELAAFTDALIATLADDERDEALHIGMSRLIGDVARMKRREIIGKLNDAGVPLYHGGATLTIEQAKGLLDLCDSYVSIEGERRRAGGCSSDDLRLVAEDYRRSAAEAISRAQFFGRLAERMDAVEAPTLDDLAHHEMRTAGDS